jgi:SAM-dependent methyltransferase
MSDSEPVPALDNNQLSEISRRTIADYNDRAQWFQERTRDHDVSQNLTTLLRHINKQTPSQLLDFGCGPGRDLKTLSKEGHRVIGLDGCGNFCTMAREHSGCEVWQQDFLQLNLPDLYFDGIFANATLFHVPGQELPRILNELHSSLKPGGILLSSNPHGQNEEGWQRQRYASLHDPQQWQVYMTTARFTLLESYYRPDGLPRDQQPWLVTVWKKQPQ